LTLNRQCLLGRTKAREVRRKGAMSYLDQGGIYFQHIDGKRVTFSVLIKRKEARRERRKNNKKRWGGMLAFNHAENRAFMYCVILVRKYLNLGMSQFFPNSNV